MIGSNQRMHDALTRLRIPHYYEEYDGDHTNKVRERVERNLLPFFAKNLVSSGQPDFTGIAAGVTAAHQLRQRDRHHDRRAAARDALNPDVASHQQRTLPHAEQPE